MFFACSDDGMHASCVLLGMAIAILLQLRDTILKHEECGDIMRIISSFLKQLVDSEQIEALFCTTKLIVGTLDRDKMADLRKRHRHQVATEFAAVELNRQEQRLKKMNIMTKATTRPSHPDASRRQPSRPPPTQRWTHFLFPTSIKKAWKKTTKLHRSKTDQSDLSCNFGIEQIRMMGEKLERIEGMYQRGELDQEEFTNMQRCVVEACYGEPVSPRTVRLRISAVETLHHNKASEPPPMLPVSPHVLSPTAAQALSNISDSFQSSGQMMMMVDAVAEKDKPQSEMGSDKSSS